MKESISPLVLLVLVMFLAACETTESSALSPGQIIADLEAYRLVFVDTDETEEHIEFLVVFREDSPDRPHVRLSGGDELGLFAGGESIEFREERDDVTDAVSYLAEWSEPVDSTTTFTIRFSRESGESYDSSVTMEVAPVISEPVAGFEWDPDSDELDVSWENADPAVDNLAIHTSCTRYYTALGIAGLTFTLPPGTLVRNDDTEDTCDGYIELVQEMVEGDVSESFDEESEFVVDQAVRIAVTARY